MFAGLVHLDSQARSTSNIDRIHLPLDRTMGQGGSGVAPGVFQGVVSAGGGSHRRLGRRPGYMREQEEGRKPPQSPAPSTESTSHSAPLHPGPGLLHQGPTSPHPGPAPLHTGPAHPHPGPAPPPVPRERQLCPRAPSASNPQPLPRSGPGGDRAVSPCGTSSPAPPAGGQSGHFTSSFSFIRLSLTSDPGADRAPPLPPPPAPPEQPVVSTVTDKQSRGDPAATPEPKDPQWDSDCCSLSDSASASSLTSGYESAAPVAAGEPWDALLRGYEGVLQACLNSSRRNAQIEAMMLKLQRLQQKAVLEDDYDTAERFGQKLAELGRERGALQLGLPSRHPAVSHFLERLRAGVGAALQETEGTHSGERAELAVQERGRGSLPGTGSTADPRKRRAHLLQEHQRVQKEMQDLGSRLRELQQCSRRLEEELQQEEELEEGVAPALRGSTPAQLRELSRALEDLVTSQHRAQICTQPPALLLRLQEQEAALKACIKETTAKVVMSQRLGGGLRRRVSASETQLLTLHEAKLAAISGSDFSSAKELKAELRALYGERDRLESLAKRLRALSSGNTRELARMKSEHCILKQELQQRQAQYESTQRENTLKYIELLEDKLHSCGNSVLERVWEADLEVCQLLLRAPGGCVIGREEEAPPPEPRPEPHPKQPPDCAMLTALGGRWCSETGLQHSEFTKKLEEFLFCMEDSQDPCDVASEVTEVMEQCELIGRRLESLEEQLQTAILDRDPALAQSLHEEVQEVKSTLLAIQRHLEEEEEEEEEDDMEERDGEEDEDHYFSDSWTI